MKIQYFKHSPVLLIFALICYILLVLCGKYSKIAVSVRFSKYKKSNGQKKTLGGHSVKRLSSSPVCFLLPFVIRAAIVHSCLGYLCSENLSARRVSGSTPFLLYNMRCFGKYNTFLRELNIFISFMRLEREKSIVFLIFFNF